MNNVNAIALNLMSLGSGSLRGLSLGDVALIIAWTLILIVYVAGQALRFSRFRGHASLKNGVVTLPPSKIETSGGIYQISGTASVKRVLSLKLALGSARRYSVEGTLQAPQVVAEGGTVRPPASPTTDVMSTATPPRSGPGLTQ